MKRLIWLFVITSALGLASVPEASAHGGQYRAYERHYVVRHGHSYPYWLRRQYDFHRWYRHSQYRYDFHLSWERLFDFYRYERRYHRPYRYHDGYGRNHQRKYHRHH